MRSDLGGIKKRLARLELLQRQREQQFELRRCDQEFRDLAPVLVNYEALTPEQEDEVFQRLLRLFRLEHEGGLPLTTSLDKLPEPFKTAVYQALAAGLDKEVAPPAEMRS
jgi:hypothetical protein